MNAITKYFNIKRWIEEQKINGEYIINEDLTIDVNEDITITTYGNFPDYIQFRNVYGEFDCSCNSMDSLKGCPKYVKGDFCCHMNNLTSIKGCPSLVEGGFYCHDNTKDEFKLPKHITVYGCLFGVIIDQ